MKTIFRLSILGIFICFLACQSDTSNSNTESSTDTAENTAETSTESGANEEPQFQRITGSGTEGESEEKKQAEMKMPEIPLTPAAKAGETAFQEYTCMGNEPNWNIQIKPSGITWFLMGESRVQFPYKRPIEEGNAIVFNSEKENRSISIKIMKERCQDTMADVVHPFTSEITVDGRVFKGCAQ